MPFSVFLVISYITEVTSLKDMEIDIYQSVLRSATNWAINSYSIKDLYFVFMFSCRHADFDSKRGCVLCKGQVALDLANFD